MVVQFARHSDKPPTLTCIRDDGSVTWFRAGHNGEFFVAHDLLHYAVETTLGFSTAFYGMIAAGRDLNDFGSQDGRPDERQYSEEALQAEQLVGLIQVLFPPGAEVEFSLFENACRTNAIGDHAISADLLSSIHGEWLRLLDVWRNTPTQASLSLEYPRDKLGHSE